MNDAPAFPSHLQTSADRVVARLVRNGLVVRSLWFPTRRDLDAWERSGCPVYIRKLGPTRVEVGPHLHSMWAAVFSPVLLLEIGDGDRPPLVATRRLNRVTLTVLVGWGVALIAWAVALITGAVPDALPFWVVSAAATISAPTVGWIFGGRALDAGIPWLTEVLLAPEDEEDW